MNLKRGMSISMQHNRLAPAFTLLELIFVIVILGIVASLGSEMIAKVYSQYIVQRAQYRATLKTELAATQIANRLRYAIPGTIIRIDSSDGLMETMDEAMTRSGDAYDIHQWVGYDGDSFEATDKPGWSGFCDVNSSSKSSIKTPGSKLSTTNTIKGNLGSANNFAIFFPYDTTSYFGSGTTDTIVLDNNTSHIVEHYKLARTSYVLDPFPNTEGRDDLYLYYNFSPEFNASRAGATKSLLLKNIGIIKFKGGGGTIRFKICKQENIGEEHNITSCKEKAVF